MKYLVLTLLSLVFLSCKVNSRPLDQNTLLSKKTDKINLKSFKVTGQLYAYIIEGKSGNISLKASWITELPYQNNVLIPIGTIIEVDLDNNIPQNYVDGAKTIEGKPNKINLGYYLASIKLNKYKGHTFMLPSPYIKVLSEIPKQKRCTGCFAPVSLALVGRLYGYKNYSPSPKRSR